MLRYKGKPQMYFNTDKLNRVCQSARACTAAQLLALCVTILATGCSSTQYKRMVYDALRQQDCIINQLDSFCNRTFALDFYDYTQIRRDFMNGLADQPLLSDERSGNSPGDLLALQSVGFKPQSN